MYVVAVLVLAVLVGWIATLIMQTDIQRVCLVNFSVAILGAGAGAGILGPYFGITPIDHSGFNLPSILVAWLAAMLLVGTTNLLRRGTLR
jgi:uncharacterized membrane protein YeaQ/YmgE (transglycosylase-associated protein family)